MIYLDSCLVIYLAERHSSWADRVAGAMSSADATQFGISPLVKCECLVGPIKRGDEVLREAYIQLFEQFVPLVMPDAVYLRAAELRGRFGLRTPDALHLACAQHHRCDALWTSDDRLSRVSLGLAIDVITRPNVEDTP
ncbi:MAG TPA: type II toxin-antitoxin system VapC family toxin [Stellaceae bacterium]|nr:type II toxin-antitoxin system VapC family toxin [Stellaceae bacterium]